MTKLAPPSRPGDSMTTEAPTSPHFRLGGAPGAASGGGRACRPGDLAPPHNRPGRLDDDRGTDVAPFQVGGLTLGGDADRATIDHQFAVLDLHGALELPVGRVVPEHVRHVVDV